LAQRNAIPAASIRYYSSFVLCGVLLAYAPPTIAPMMKKAMGWNFVPDALGDKIMREIVDRVVAKKIRPVIGKTLPFEELPQALTAMRDRKTVGRTIITLY
jgi:NADPH:quinone reductase-like Zn-dependent oxidoreductase